MGRGGGGGVPVPDPIYAWNQHLQLPAHYAVPGHAFWTCV